MNWQRGLSLGITMLALSFLAGISHADTISFIGSYEDVFAQNEYFSPGSSGNSFFFSEEPITGISKFDPALGTLTAILLEAEYLTSLEVEVSALDVTDETLSHSLDFDGNSMSFFIGYGPTGSSSTFAPITYDAGVNASCAGDPFDAPCNDVFGVSEQTTGLADLFTQSGLVMSDFVGAGDVDTLDAIIAVSNSGSFVLDNLDDATANVSGVMSNEMLTVTYVYTPVPEPSTFFLLIVGLAFFGLKCHARF